MIPAYSPEARGRSERMFRTHQDRLLKELAAANRYLKEVYSLSLQRRVHAACPGGGIGGELDDILCEQHERVVGKDNCVACEGMKLPIPSDRNQARRQKATKCL